MSFQNRLTVPGEGSVLSKKFAVEAAEKQQDAIDEQCKRLKEDPPSYRLLELIGKGAYGRVYKRWSLAFIPFRHSDKYLNFF